MKDLKRNCETDDLRSLFLPQEKGRLDNLMTSIAGGMECRYVRDKKGTMGHLCQAFENTGKFVFNYAMV